MKKIIILLVISLTTGLLSAQRINSVNSAAGFLTISPDARGSALGMAGVATSPDINSQFWNPAKYVFAENKMGGALNYIPWSTKMNDGSFNTYIPVYYKIDNNQAVSGSFRYYTYGDEINLVDENNQLRGRHTPNEFAIDLAYARRLGEYFSGAVSFRYIRSAITKDVTNSGDKAGQAVAADLSMFFYKPIQLFTQDFTLGAGANISNIGSKISYNKNGQSSFLPMNLRLGGSLGYELDKKHNFTITLDFNKFLVPTPSRNEDGTTGDAKLDKSIISAIFSSFGDAPDGFSEEIKEITTSIGFEYNYMKMLSLRCGYFTQAEEKGGVKLITTGAGIIYKKITFDVAYLVPTYNKFIHNNEWRFTLGIKL
ncbi:MAG: type IX secretion system outer membrane channel protein PorV [Prevotellaceae bacterium]|jgi:hypothetical protein|nr:type IX secretion system outer membrane channel protein PorV [Prevotellaceae bacterium]